MLSKIKDMARYIRTYRNNDEGYICAGPIIPSPGGSLGHKLYSYAKELHNKGNREGSLSRGEAFEMVNTFEFARKNLEWEVHTSNAGDKKSLTSVLKKTYESLLQLSRLGIPIALGELALSEYAEGYEARIKEISKELGQ